MRVVLDTNVFVSGIFFSGPPFDILDAWRRRRLRIVVSADVLDEYRRVGERLALSHTGVDVAPWLLLLASHGEVVSAPALTEAVCTDPTDDKFFACAIAGRCRIIVSGDRHLHEAHGFRGIEVVRPRWFVDRYLK